VSRAPSCLKPHDPDRVPHSGAVRTTTPTAWPAAARVGLLAGYGRFPILFAQAAARQGCDVICLAIRGEASPELAQLAAKFHWVGVAQLGRTIRLLNDVLTEFPSIVIGIFAYLVIVLATGRFSAFAGSFALAIIMLPVIARTTEESLRLVPNDVREAALALGVPKWKATLFVTVPAAKGGVVTGILLAVARIMGETAPLILTVLGSSFWFSGFDQPTAAMPLTIYTYAISPFPDWHEKAWGAAFVLLMIVLTLNIVVRAATGRGMWRWKLGR